MNLPELRQVTVGADLNNCMKYIVGKPYNIQGKRHVLEALIYDKEYLSFFGIPAVAVYLSTDEDTFLWKHIPLGPNTFPEYNINFE